MSKSNDTTLVIAQCVDDNTVFLLTEIRQRFAIDDVLFAEMLEHGLIDLPQPHSRDATVNQQTVQHIRTAINLHHELGVNIAGSAVIVEMLEELQRLRRELHILRRHLQR